MSFTVESAASRRHRKARRTAITLVLVLVLVAAAFYYAASYWRNPGRSAASGCPTATATTAAAKAAAAKPAAAAPKPNQITINVYNATTRSGLAADTAAQVKARGYVIGAVSNDPLAKAITGTAELRYGQAGTAQATVAKQLVAGVALVKDGRADGSVDLVLGDAFKTLASVAASAGGSTASPC